jgi:hypothetical protein
VYILEVGAGNTLARKYCQTYPGENIRNTCGKTLKKLGFIKRVVGRYSDEKVKETCYFALVRPHLEYAASIWDHGHKDLIGRLNKLQGKVARFVKKSLRARTESHRANTRTRLGTVRDSEAARQTLFRSVLFQSDTADIKLTP